MTPLRPLVWLALAVSLAAFGLGVTAHNWNGYAQRLERALSALPPSSPPVLSPPPRLSSTSPAKPRVSPPPFLRSDSPAEVSPVAPGMQITTGIEKVTRSEFITRYHFTAPTAVIELSFHTLYAEERIALHCTARTQTWRAEWPLAIEDGAEGGGSVSLIYTAVQVPKNAEIECFLVSRGPVRGIWVLETARQ